MTISNFERIGKCLHTLKEGLSPFVIQQFRATYSTTWKEQLKEVIKDDRFSVVSDDKIDWDIQAVLNVMWFSWNEVFNKVLGHAERSFVSELKEIRNNWAHQQSFKTDDAYRAIDTMTRLLQAISSPVAPQLDQQKQELLRLRFEEQARNETKKINAAQTSGQPSQGLKPWRDVVTPHADVMSGLYQQAEFAADLAQVHAGEGSKEYKDPQEFFKRTYITGGLKDLLINALLRINGKGGDPVIELQTNFGGGKTHSMLALYHLFSGILYQDLLGIEAILTHDMPKPILAKRAVIVGTAIPPGQPHIKADGTVIRTFWGELAWQLLGTEGYKLVEESDINGTNPGSELLVKILRKSGPTLILIDEWVAFVRQLYNVEGLPAGSFDANLTFAQSLTEAVKQCSQTLFVASIPSSDIEIGGEGGRKALSKLEHTFDRLESSWRPATADEGFEIVRRRLFETKIDYTSRDVVVKAYMDLYMSNQQEFPSDCRELDYERRLKASYPIHPELFDRLYNDWSTLDRFQRTRGVLRLMAAVVHESWVNEDKNLLIMPGTIPLEASSIRSEFLRYIDNPWDAVISKDIDGSTSYAFSLDRDNPNLGRYSACRRVTRTIFVGSAATLNTANKGIDDKHIKLGCVQPGEAVPTFGDALRRMSMSGGSTHLYTENNRYWFDTQPSIGKLAKDRAAQFPPHIIDDEIKNIIKQELGQNGDFSRLHPFPQNGADVADDKEAKLVILGPEYPRSSSADHKAMVCAKQILESRGSSPRIYRNTIVFACMDENRLEELREAVRNYLAWKSIEGESDSLNLTPYHLNQAKTQKTSSFNTTKSRIPEVLCWAIVPSQKNPQSPLEWHEYRLQGQDSIAVKTSKKLISEGQLVNRYAGTVLRMELDKIPLWRGNHVSTKQLAEDFAQYTYLPRLTNLDLLLEAIQDGVNCKTWQQDTFAYADLYDESEKRYKGLKTFQHTSTAFNEHAIVVKPDIAKAQLDKEVAVILATPSGTSTPMGQAVTQTATTTLFPDIPDTVIEKTHKRFYATHKLDATRIERDTHRLVSEVIQHVTGLMGAEVDVSIEVNAKFDNNIPDDVIRTVSENCRTLGINFSFEEE